MFKIINCIKCLVFLKIFLDLIIFKNIFIIKSKIYDIYVLFFETITIAGRNKRILCNV